jgi:hypothetical protein
MILLRERFQEPGGFLQDMNSYFITNCGERAKGAEANPEGPTLPRAKFGRGNERHTFLTALAYEFLGSGVR